MAGVIRRFIAQKIKHPISKEWIETMYMTDDGAEDDIKIYWHGIPADNNVIEERHLALKAVTTDRIDDGAITTKNIGWGAVKTAQIDQGAVTPDKLDNNLKAALNATVANGTLNLPQV